MPGPKLCRLASEPLPHVLDERRPIREMRRRDDLHRGIPQAAMGSAVRPVVKRRPVGEIQEPGALAQRAREMRRGIAGRDQ